MTRHHYHMDLPHGHTITMFLFNQNLVKKSTIVGAPCVEAKIIIWCIIKNLAIWFQTCPTWQNIIYQQKHILHCHVIYACCCHGHCNGRQVKHSYNLNLLIKDKWSDIIIIYTIQNSFDKRYFNRFNNIIVKQLF